MPTYAGYQRIDKPDLSAPFREQMAGLMNKRALESQKAAEIAREDLKMQKAANDKFEANHLANMQSIYEGAKFDNPIKGLDERVFQGVRTGADQLSEVAKMKRQGLISERDYNLNALNRKTSISNIGKIYDNIESISTTQSERIANNMAGWREKERAMYNAELFNLENHTIGWLPDGNATWQTIDSEGNVIGEMPIINMASANNMENQFTERINLEQVAADVAKQPDNYTYTSGSKTITDLRKKKGYSGWINDNINIITDGDNENRLVDLLMDGNISSTIKLDNGEETEIFGSGIRNADQLEDIYIKALTQAETDKGSQLTEEEAKRIEEEVNKMTFTIIEKGGKDTYSMSNYAKDLVRKSIQEKIEFNLGYKETKASSGNGNGEIDIDSVSDKKIQLYKDVQRAIQNEDYSGLNTDLFSFKRFGNKITVTPNVGEFKEKLIDLGFSASPVEIDLTKENAGNILARYAGTKTPATAASDYNIGAVLSAQGVPAASDYGAAKQAPDRSTPQLDFMTAPLTERYKTEPKRKFN